jgi:hypothetical protein
MKVLNKKNDTQSDSCNLVIVPDDICSERIVRHLASYGNECRLLVDNLQNFKRKIFDVYEKFDAIYDLKEYEINEKKFSKEFDHIISLNNGKCVNKIMIFSPSNRNYEGVDFLYKFQYLIKNLQIFNLLEGSNIKNDELKIILFNFVEGQPDYDSYRNQAFFLENFFEDAITKLGFKYIVLKTPEITESQNVYKKKEKFDQNPKQNITYSNLFFLIDESLKIEGKNITGENKIVVFNNDYFRYLNFLNSFKYANYYLNLYNFSRQSKIMSKKIYIKEKKVDKDTFKFGQKFIFSGLVVMFSAFLFRKYSF